MFSRNDILNALKKSDYVTGAQDWDTRLRLSYWVIVRNTFRTTFIYFYILLLLLELNKMQFSKKSNVTKDAEFMFNRLDNITVIGVALLGMFFGGFRRKNMDHRSFLAVYIKTKEQRKKWKKVVFKWIAVKHRKL